MTNNQTVIPEMAKPLSGIQSRMVFTGFQTKNLIEGTNALCITEQTLFHEEKAAQRARKGLRDHAGVQGCTVCVTPNEILVCEGTA